jgi:hypothetical protein
MADNEAAVNGLSAFGSVIAITLFSSQLGLARKMWREGDASKYSFMPTATLLLTCLMWGA